MIPFRYHIVTIVAVFLAFAIGLLAGSAFVDPALTRQLQAQTDRLRTELNDAQGAADQLSTYADAALGYLTEGRLAGSTAVVVTQEGVGSDVVGSTQQALAAAGADVVAVLTARAGLGSDDPDIQHGLEQILGEFPAAAGDLPSLAARALARRLSSGSADGSSENDLLSKLLSAGFLDSDVSESTLQDIGVPGQIVVVLGGGPSDRPAVTSTTFAVPLVQELALDGVAVAAGESSATPEDVSFVAEVRAGSTEGTVTIDDLDLGMGVAALVLGLDELLTTGTGGAYGFRDGADPLPPPS